jgi:hypothetical protein
MSFITSSKKPPLLGLEFNFIVSDAPRRHGRRYLSIDGSPGNDLQAIDGEDRISPPVVCLL